MRGLKHFLQGASLSDAVQKTCFVVSPIGADNSLTRNRADKLYKYVICEVMEARGYKVERSDNIGEPGIITNQIVNRIVECSILIADLSEHNPNVFYELAIRHGLKKPFIHLITSGEKIPFDNSQVRTISFDITDLDSVQRAKSELNKQVDVIESGKAASESPISVAFDLDVLKSSGKSDEVILASVLEQMSAMRSEIRRISYQVRPNRSVDSSARYKIPSSFNELIFILQKEEEDDILQILMGGTEVKYRPGEITLVDPIGLSDGTEDRIESTLRRLTGAKWAVNTVPF